MSRDAIGVDQGPPVRTTYNFTAAGPDADRREGPESAPAGDMSFWDFLDVINPLQHIPVVSTLYRAVTGDTLGQPARVMGGLLYGGPIGLMAGVVSSVVEQETGKDPGEHVLALFDGPDEAAATQTAAAEPPPEKAPEPTPETPKAAETPMVTTGSASHPVPTAVPPLPVADKVESPRPDTKLQAEQAAWPPGGPPSLPPDRVADVMKRNYQKYEALARTPPAAGQQLRIDG
ncbi:MAG TPA: hypothetical protein VEB64_17430 [Azospirillaceae bacterium]|nr:hypothetical protein [Azospirillaceae bacterium]